MAADGRVVQGAKVSFGIPHKISYPYIEKCVVYIDEWKFTSS